MKKQSVRDLIFDPTLYTEYPYHWEEKDKDGKTIIVFSKTPRYTLLEKIEMINKIKNIRSDE